MRIAQVAPLFEAVPPHTYGGTERVVSYLTEELVGAGHEVTLFASGDSVTSARLTPGCQRAIRLDRSVRDPLAAHLKMIEEVCQRSSEFDIIHGHLDYWAFSVLSRLSTPFVTTLHGRLDLPELQPVYDCFRGVSLVSISNAQRQPLQQGHFVATVYHGLPEGLLAPTGVERGYLAFLGRICPEKRPDLAIEIARRAGMPLKIAAKVDQVDVEYFDTVIKPLLAGDDIDFIGEISETEKSAFLSAASALLLPIDWPEPFGLVLIEAMACGTPVIAFKRGSVPEILEDGLTGWIVDSVDEAVAATRRLQGLSAEAVRAEFDRRFTARRMALDYVDVYETLVQASRPGLRLVD
ncbi:glycosyltransferase family 4 protein [Acidisphaera rubrifaciens]|uniref:Glycosyl transferase n=1 Tax=Acidisphaera rubrifaciens HS-AP3 TaxID=1231350 RepID=A0A0D6P4V4_9PROT|nr:glycosyltransferase family 4 protein [Acidisphaera rubrifaciens]GAN76682.1 glycosyl transferase [Acidisphaera rubrifaciens HS-AP3]